MSVNLALEEARKTVVILFAAGLVMVVLGSMVAVGAWPHTEIDPTVGGAVDTGSAFWTMLAVGVAGAGQLLAAIAVVAWGVRFGIESAEPPAARATGAGSMRPRRRVWLEEEGRFVDEPDDH